MSDEKKDEEVTLKKSDLETMLKEQKESIDAENAKKIEEIEKNFKADNEKVINLAVEKAVATRKSIEDTGLDLDGEPADLKKSLETVVSKSEKRHLDSGKPTEWEAELQKRNDDLVWLTAVAKSPKSDFEVSDVLKSTVFSRYVNHITKNKDHAISKALDSTSGKGSEWIPTLLSSRLTDKIEVALRVASQFQRIQLPGAKVDIPRIDGFPTAFKGSILTALSGADLTQVDTDKSSFDVVKLIAETRIAFETDMDAIIPLIPLSENHLSLAIARAIDDAIINGDDSGTHMDADVTAANDRRKSWKGLRKLSIDNSNLYDVSGVWTLAKFRAFINTLAFEFGSNFEDLVLFMNKDSFNQIRGLSDVTTIDKFGSAATIVQGRITKLDNIDIIPSQHPREDLQGPTAKFVATATDTGSVNVSSRQFFGWGVWQGVRLDSDRDIGAQSIQLVGSMRGDFEALMDPALKGYATAHNITLV